MPGLAASGPPAHHEPMTSVDFYYDPSCPFCWITSRWLLRVQGERDIDITWRPFSLAMKNHELADDSQAKTEHGEPHRRAHYVLRVLEAARRQGASVIDLYSAFGRRVHVDGGAYSDAMIAEVLAEAGLPAELAQAAHDESYDAHLESEMKSALAVLGDDVGVPIIVFTDGDQPQGYFGPVLNEMPGEDESLALWDGLVQLAPVRSFYELKRTRPGGMPNTASTKGL